MPSTPSSTSISADGAAFHSCREESLVSRIVAARDSAGTKRDDALEPPEELNAIENNVAPSGRDAIAAVVRLAMVTLVRAVAKNQADSLQVPHSSRRPLHVRPLMDL